MNVKKIIISLVLATSILIVQVGRAFAAPTLQDSTPISGTVQSIILETDPSTGITTVFVNLVRKDQSVQTVRVSLETSITLGLLTLDGDGKPVINTLALGQPIEIDASTVIPEGGEGQHPVGSALATFFSDIAGLDYEAIMDAHEQGLGFGVIAQALWLTLKLEGDSELFEAILEAKQTGDYSAFSVFNGGIPPKNWGQLRKAILKNEKKNNPGDITSDKEDNGNGNYQDKNKEKNKDKRNKGNGNGNSGNK